MARDYEQGDNLGTGNGGKSRFDRRKYLKLVGGATASVAALGTAGSATADEFETITVPAGGSKRLTVGSDETLENVLIDISADNADARIIANGQNWTIRNVGFKGSADRGSNSGGFPNLIAAQGTGTIEQVYLGDGVSGDLVRKGAIGVGANHSGHISLREVHMAEWTANAIYAAGMARSNGGGGTLSFDRCYFRDNNIAHLRIASDGTSVKNSVIHNTNNVYLHPFNNGVVNSRGIYTGYGDSSQSVAVENTHIDVTSSNTNGASSAAVSQHTTINLRNCEVNGRIIGNVTEANIGNSPAVAVPDGVPTSPEAAASNGKAPGSSSSGASGTNLPANTLTVTGTGDPTEYYVETTGELVDDPGTGTLERWDSIDDTSATGWVTDTAQVDQYRFAGDLHEVAFRQGSAHVEVNGEAIDPDQYNGDEPSLDNTLLVDGVGTSGGTRYEFAVSGAAEKATVKGATIDAGDTIDGGRITGSVAGWRDGFRFSGELTDLTLDGDASVYVNGEQVDPADYGDEQPHVLTLVGNGSSASYEITVDGTIDTVAGDASEESATVLSDTVVEGSIKRDDQRFRFSGTLSEVTFHAGSAHVYLDDQRIDPDEYNGQEHPPNAIVIDGAGTDGESSYSFAVDGDVVASSYRDASVDPGDVVNGTSVSGSVDEELDAYWFNGDITDFSLTGNASVDVEYNARSQ